MEERQHVLPFEGLHVYQRAQETWFLAGAGPGLLRDLFKAEVREAVLAIARGTARSRSSGGFAAELENARAALHAAAAITEQLTRRGNAPDERVQTLITRGVYRFLQGLTRYAALIARMVERRHSERKEASDGSNVK